MSDLFSESCSACRVDAPQVSDEEAKVLLQAIPDWQKVHHQGVYKLQRRYSFQNFAEALKFTNQVGELAEQFGHHPVIEFSWGYVLISWWTHKINGLHRNDFILSAKTDRIFS